MCFPFFGVTPLDRHICTSVLSILANAIVYYQLSYQNMSELLCPGIIKHRSDHPIVHMSELLCPEIIKHRSGHPIVHISELLCPGIIKHRSGHPIVHMWKQPIKRAHHSVHFSKSPNVCTDQTRALDGGHRAESRQICRHISCLCNFAITYA